MQIQRVAPPLVTRTGPTKKDVQKNFIDFRWKAQTLTIPQKISVTVTATLRVTILLIIRKINGNN